MYIINKPTEFRENIVNKIAEIIAQQQTPSTDSLTPAVKETIVNMEASGVVNVESLPLNIERGIYNYSLKEATNRKIIKKWENKYFVQIYVDRLKTVVFNLKETPLLVEKLVTGYITPELFASMSHQEMYPEKWNELIAMKIKRDESKYVNRVEASTDMYQCRKCKSRKCTYYSVQLRSADEPMTTLISCLECSYNWKN
jgi:DNA-directed RNA polymerase subunit M/transcription elongation factor TFIIS